MTSSTEKNTYRSLTEPQALSYLYKLKKSNKYIRHKLTQLECQFSQKNLRLTLMKNITLQLLRKPTLEKLKNYIMQLSKLNIQSGQKVEPIYKEIRFVETPLHQIQTGDYVPLHIIETSGKSLVQQILSSQIDPKNVTIIPRTKQQTKLVTIIPQNTTGKKARAKTKYRLKNKDKEKKKENKI